MRSMPAALFGVLAACSPRVTTIAEVVDAGPPSTLTITGRACSERPEATGFPTKVVLLIDNGQANCIIDPPGALREGSFCSTHPVSLATVPGRVRALHRLLDTLAAISNVSVALIPFDNNVFGAYPAQSFVRATDGSLRLRVSDMQAQLGEESDFEGALGEAYARIASDAQLLRSQGIVGRTRYSVVLVTDGPPSPRCAGTDNLQRYADDLDPSAGPWADTHLDLCNQTLPAPKAILGFTAGTNRNQDDQLLSLVSRLKGLEASMGVGEIQVSTVFLSNPETVASCGADCEMLFGIKQRSPGAVPVSPLTFATTEARGLLRRLSTQGGGTFTEVVGTTQLQAMTFSPQHYESLASINTVRELLVESVVAMPSHGTWALDDDGDGVPNDDEAAKGTNAQLADTDADGFSDRFELDRTASGFDPLVKDSRGCASANCILRDTDGDGLTSDAEAFLGTSESFVDSDADGFPDGLEVRFGLDPTRRLEPSADADADGVTDADELRRGTHPLQADAALRGATITWTQTAQPDASQCYDFTAVGVPLVASVAGGRPAGSNVFKVWFGAAPELARADPGDWKASCVAARRDTSQELPILVPPSLARELPKEEFRKPNSVKAPYTSTNCVGLSDLSP